MYEFFLNKLAVPFKISEELSIILKVNDGET
jgi:hypothetical protein